jgi:4-aminobutyrate aminotransferase-like enzyme
MMDDRTNIPATEKASEIVQRLKDFGILTNTIGPDENILKLRPPMIFSRENADFFLMGLDKVLQEVRYD